MIEEGDTVRDKMMGDIMTVKHVFSKGLIFCIIECPSDSMRVISPKRGDMIFTREDNIIFIERKPHVENSQYPKSISVKSKWNAFKASIECFHATLLKNRF